MPAAKPKETKKNKFVSVILDRETAKRKYSTKYLYCVAKREINDGVDRSHSQLLRRQGATVASANSFKAAEETCWRDLMSAQVARSFALVYRLMRKVIAAKGNNKFLCEGELHAQVRKDYLETATGIRRKDAYRDMCYSYR